MTSTELDTLTAISNALLGAAGLAGALVVAHAVRRFGVRARRASYLAFACLLAVSAVLHLVLGYGAASASFSVLATLRLLQAGCAVGAILLLKNATVRVSSLLTRAQEAQRRESDLNGVLNELSAAYSRLQNLAELKTQVFANVSHELRTPLTLILGPIRALREASELKEEQHAALTMVERNALLLLGHVNDLLELSRADAVGVALKHTSTDVGALMSALTASFRPLAQDLGIEYLVDLTRSLPPLTLDPEKLERIAMNLLANAFKFTPSGGKVAISVHLAEAGDSQGSLPELVLAIDDSGPGIRREDRELVFERFRQLDGKPNRSFSGTGLGLAIVREFVSAARGVVHVEDSALGGARFLVRLPADAADTQPDTEGEPFSTSLRSAEMLALQSRPPSTLDAASPADLPLILVVEDNLDMNRFVCSSLASEFRVASAFDGQQALARLENLTPDLIITDYMMPRMSGDELVEALQSDPVRRDVPVLVLTARDDVDLRVEGLSKGVQDWLTKPFTVTELVARARNLVSARRARSILRAELASREFDVGALASQLAERKHQLESLLDSLSQALEQAEVASRFKTSLLRLVSHELRTPLGALSLQLERLSGEHRGPLNEAQQQLVLRMRRSLSRLTDMIQSLLEYARIESGRLDLNVETFDMRELARSVVEDFAIQAETKGLGLRLAAPETCVEFSSDPRLVRLVLVNLVANALKFTGRGEVVVTVSVGEERCELTVLDTGPGIALSLRTTVFEPFFQGESAAHSQYSQGAGLGLSLVREMLHALGGSIELDSELGVGSTFRISVPRAALLNSQTLLTDRAQNSA